jgi:homoserine dehydrogenase
VRINLVLTGFGNVARRFVRLLDESHDTLTSLALQPVVVAIVTRAHGAVYDEAGVDTEQAVRQRATGHAIGPPTSPSLVECLSRLTYRPGGSHALIETTTLDVQSGEPAISHVRAAFAAKVHVITANKGPVAFAYRALAREATQAGVAFLFEGAVMDGVPVFNLVRETMPGVKIIGFRGVLNSTTNFILTALERGEPFGDALARMQSEGVAEADPSMDLDGWDAAAKTAALANVLLDADLTPPLVRREVVVPDTAGRARAAFGQGRRLKLVASGSRRDREVEGRVQLQELAPGDPMWSVDGQGNALELDTWPLGRIVITQRDGGLEKTAYALLSDLVTLAKRLRATSIR